MIEVIKATIVGHLAFIQKTEIYYFHWMTSADNQIYQQAKKKHISELKCGTIFILSE